MYLVLDDDRFGAAALKDHLLAILGNEAEEQVKIVFSPKQALRVVDQDPPALIFLDIEMPEISGFDFWDHLKTKGYRGHFICTTVHDHFVLKALRKRALDFLLKPIDRSELSAALERYRAQKSTVSLDLKQLEELGLSQRQIEICRLTLAGKTSAAIAEQLFLSKHTVDTHRRNILRRTDSRSMNDLLAKIQV